MGNKRKKLEAQGLDEKEWQTYLHRCQQEYIRVKLRSVKRYWEGASFGQVAGESAISEMSVRKYVNQYLQGGLKGLTTPTTRRQPRLLTAQQEQAFRQVLLTTFPEDLELQQFTGGIFQAAILTTSKCNWYCWGLRLPDAEWRLLLLYHPSIYSKIESLACCFVG